MIMSKEKKLIQKEDIMPLDVYTKQRKELRKNIVEFKKNRRISLGLTQHFILKVMKQCWLKFRKCFT